MKLIWKLIVVAALAIGGLVGAGITPASAYLSDCHAVRLSSGYGAQSYCNSVLPNGGLNQQRVKVYCHKEYVADQTLAGWYYGPWTSVNQLSIKYCPSDLRAQSATYELR